MQIEFKDSIQRLILASLAVVVICAGSMAFIHTRSGQRIPVVRQLALWLNVNCPADHITSTQMDEWRAKAATILQGDLMAPLRPALGLELNETTIRQAAVWLEDKGLDCVHGVRGYAFLRCHKVDPKILGMSSSTPIDEFDLSFNSKGKLVSVNLLHRKLTPENGVEVFTEIVADLKEDLGMPNKISGDLSVQNFKTPLSAVSVEYNYKDYLAKVTASSLPWSGVVIYEQYMSLE